MKSLITVMLITLSLNSFASPANDCFKTVLNNVVKGIDAKEFKDNKKALSEGLKSCNDVIKQERLAKRREKVEAQIKKLQAKLSAN